ncbi:MAG TPA: acyltransferase [Xanthobacteraceae bacterium]|nr:acyltransferase [Xanthobacteraceae bacterium]
MDGPPNELARPAGPLQDASTIFYPRLEALRGVAALTVAAFHSWQSIWIDAGEGRRNFLSADGTVGWVEQFGTGLLRVFGNGHGAVMLFFVISGFVLCGSLARGPQDFYAAAMRFLPARLFRIYPAIFATIGIFAVLYWTTGVLLGPADAYGPFGLLRNALLLETSIDGVMWSLQIELIAVPLILLAFLGSVRWGLILAVMLFLVLAALSFSGAWNRAIGGSGMLGTIHAFIPGMIAFWIGHRLVERCPVRLAPALFLALLVGFVASRPVLGWTSNWSPLAEAAFGAAIVAFLAFSPVGAAGRVFDLGVVRFFGRVSYSFYLLHPLSLMIMWNMPETLGAIVRSGVPAFVVAPGLFVLSTAAIAPLAWVMFQCVERPGVAAGRALAKHLAAYVRKE